MGGRCRVGSRERGRDHPGVPYQDDYVFASPAMAERLISCEALDRKDSPSAHFPVEAIFQD
jgi:hypothetical protein